MLSTYNEGKSTVAERFIRTLKNKIFKHMTSVSNNVYFDMLDGIVNKYNNTVHRTTKMKPIDVKPDSYAECSEDSNEKVTNRVTWCPISHGASLKGVFGLLKVSKNN